MERAIPAPACSINASAEMPRAKAASSAARICAGVMIGECNLVVGVRRFFFFFVAAVELSFFVLLLVLFFFVLEDDFLRLALFFEDRLERSGSARTKSL